MFSTAQVWLEVTAVIVIVLAIPGYMGFIHVSVAGALAYALLGGLSMAIGEALHDGLSPFGLDWWDVTLPVAAVAGAGGITYGLALALI